MIITRRMAQISIHNQVYAVVSEMVSRVCGERRVSFSTKEVTECREYLVTKKMKKTPISNIKAKRSGEIPIQLVSTRCFSLTPEEINDVNTPILCRTTPIPLSLVWKVAEEMKQKNMIDPEYFHVNSEKPHSSPSDSDEENLYD
jgi:hypothetical protein